MGRPEQVEKTIRKIMAMVEDFTLEELLRVQPRYV
jgi:hypothetical protein